MAYHGPEVKLFDSKKEQERYENFAGMHVAGTVHKIFASLYIPQICSHEFIAAGCPF